MTVFDEQTQKELFITSLGLLSGMITFGIAVAIWHIDIFDILPACVFNAKTGLYCPGCGGTRSVYALLHGHIAESFLWHPIVPYTAILTLVSVVVGVRSIFKKTQHWFQFRPIHFYIWIGFLIGNWVVKNLIIICIF